MCRFSFLSFIILHFNFQPAKRHFYDNRIICNFIGTDPYSTVSVCVFVQETSPIYGLNFSVFKKYG